MTSVFLTAYNYIFTILDGFVIFAFDRMSIGSGISFGYVMMCIILLSVLIGSILRIPNKAPSHKFERGSH